MGTSITLVSIKNFIEIVDIFDSRIFVIDDNDMGFEEVELEIKVFKVNSFLYLSF